VILEDTGVIGGGFGRCRGVHFAADILDFFGDIARRAACGSLESHVFEQVGDAMLVFRLVART